MGGQDREALWREVLTGEAGAVRTMRRAFRVLPSPPRCKLCYAPFAGPAGLVLRPWFGPWERNAQLCKSCFGNLTKLGVGGAEIELSLLFADIRGSTGLGERLRPAEFSALLGAFYRVAAEAIADHDGVVDKFVGDEAIGLFIPSYAGADYAAKAVAAGRALLRAVASVPEAPDGGIPVGAGVNTGVAFVGILGSDERISGFTALGDTVNATARLAALAGPGELLVAAATAERAALDVRGFPRREVEVRGREAPLDVYVLEGSETVEGGEPGEGGARTR